jgi:hypothetical protein
MTYEGIANKALSAGVDYKNANLGYGHCTKAVATLGLLAATGDKLAAIRGREVVTAFVKAFTEEGTWGSLTRDNIDTIQRLLSDKNAPIAHRIRAFNFLAEQGVNVSKIPGRGDGIYLESGYMALCLAFGRDWLGPHFTPEERQAVDIASKHLLLWFNNLHEFFFTSSSPPEQRESNWNAVMNGGSGLLGVTTLETTAPFSCVTTLASTPTPAERARQSNATLALERTCQSIIGLRYLWRTHTEAGAYVEGPEYWFYGMPSYALFADTVKRTLGRVDFDTTARISFVNGALAQTKMIYRNGPFWRAGDPASAAVVEGFSYADSTPKYVPASFPLVYGGRVGNNPQLSEFGWAVFLQHVGNEAKYYKPPTSLAWGNLRPTGVES